VEVRGNMYLDFLNITLLHDDLDHVVCVLGAEFVLEEGV
jgi:hypothetical protein